ncbi:hypothetical protein EMIT0P100_230064 [Pseudomonas sp. IT-P100]
MIVAVRPKRANRMCLGNKGRITLYDLGVQKILIAPTIYTSTKL